MKRMWFLVAVVSTSVFSHPQSWHENDCGTVLYLAARDETSARESLLLPLSDHSEPAELAMRKAIRALTPEFDVNRKLLTWLSNAETSPFRAEAALRLATYGHVHSGIMEGLLQHPWLAHNSATTAYPPLLELAREQFALASDIEDHNVTVDLLTQRFEKDHRSAASRLTTWNGVGIPPESRAQRFVCEILCIWATKKRYKVREAAIRALVGIATRSVRAIPKLRELSVDGRLRASEPDLVALIDQVLD